jgi:DNA-binding HxlR family transcriptional regulator
MEVYVPLKRKSGISNKMFTQTVRELENGLISRKIFPVVPPKWNTN